MDYQKIYNQLITNAATRNVESLSSIERHHIVPHSLGGTNDASNIVKLTTREHYIAHLLLVKITKDDPVSHKKMVYALWWMSKTRNNLNGYKVNSRAYAMAREKFIQLCPNRDPERNEQFRANRKAGKYKYDDKKMGQTLSATLKKLSQAEMEERMRRSVLSCDQKARGKAISRGKASKLKLTKNDGSTIEFWTFDDVVKITGYNMQKLIYHIKRDEGMLPNGTKVSYIIRYAGNDGRIGRKIPRKV